MNDMKRPFISKLELLGMQIPRLTGVVPASLRLPGQVTGRRAFLMHNPKTAGTSLKNALGMSGQRTLHIWARGAFRKNTWQDSMIVCAVRDPLDRFLSGYHYHVLGDYRGYLYKIHGEALKTADPDTYFDCIKQYPDYLGPQALWFAYPSRIKPICDVLLRVERSMEWITQLESVGINLGVANIPQRNKSTRSQSDTRVSKMLLRKLVDFYAEDYEKLGYTKPTQ